MRVTPSPSIRPRKFFPAIDARRIEDTLLGYDSHFGGDAERAVRQAPRPLSVGPAPEPGSCPLMYVFMLCPLIVVVWLSFFKAPILYFPPSGYTLQWYAQGLGGRRPSPTASCVQLAGRPAGGGVRRRAGRDGGAGHHALPLRRARARSTPCCYRRCWCPASWRASPSTCSICAPKTLLDHRYRRHLRRAGGRACVPDHSVDRAPGHGQHGGPGPAPSRRPRATWAPAARWPSCASRCRCCAPPSLPRRLFSFIVSFENLELSLSLVGPGRTDAAHRHHAVPGSSIWTRPSPRYPSVQIVLLGLIMLVTDRFVKLSQVV